MRRLILAILLTSICFCAKAAEDSTFYSLSKSSTAVIQGKVISNYNHFWDFGTLEGSCDILIQRICFKDKKHNLNDLNIKINDTLRNIKYVEDAFEDTITLNKSYLFPLLVDSFVLCNKPHVVDFNNEVFSNISLLNKYCSSRFDGMSSCPSNKKTKNYTFHANGKRKSKTITKTYSDKKIITKTTMWDENGKKLNRERSKGKKYFKGSRSVIWTFRENGRICLRRGERIIK